MIPSTKAVADRPTAYGRRLAVLGLGAASLALVAPAQAGPTGVALTADNRLVGFDTDAPRTVTSTVSVSGLDAAEDLLGIDFRPAQPDQLYGISSFGQIYVINAGTGSATKVGSAIGPADLPLAGSSFGFDFNPAVDRIRLVDDLGANARLNQLNGTVVDADPAAAGLQRDGDLAYAGGDVNAGEPAGVNSVAYSNSDNDAATGTTLYGIDSAFGVLVTIDPPNAGVLNTVGSLGLADLPDVVGFDILGADAAFAVTAAEPAFGSLPALEARLLGINLGTGAATDLGAIGGGQFNLVGFALTDNPGVTPNPIPLPSAVFAAPLAFGVVGFFRHRMRRGTSRR